MWITSRHIEAGRRAMTQNAPRGGKIWWAMKVLSRIPTDGTFDQEHPLDLGPPQFVCKMSLQECQSTEPPVTDVEKGSDIDPQEAQQTLEIAQANVKTVEGRRQKIEANLALQRARTRVEAINPIS
ncbi:hypothetical protein HAX54_044781 [Datura stramonium]|uniref:ATP synthase epsilon subunit C-terminal domain-containing protein n=1 Tax=Datura stramonium TaxID=4076 RepID=A0ABS8SR25_DATST|nr:hypothetical protein [Datura stramonium]